jgi:DNA-binding response OmpR family regulator
MPDESKKLIYVVEDDPQVARLIIGTLREFGFDPQWCRTGGEMLRHLRSEAPDLCIVDLGLPDMDGMEVVRSLRADPACGVLILTGRGHTIDRVMGLELGADDYVVKPFEPRELIARVRSILRRCSHQHDKTTPARQQQAEFAGWHFDIGSNTLTCSEGQSTTLSTAESQLLRVFLEHPNRILTREQLLGERDLSSFDRSIDVRISRLRRKFNEDPQHPRLIKTVYGAGYLFSAQVTWL